MARLTPVKLWRPLNPADPRTLYEPIDAMAAVDRLQRFRQTDVEEDGGVTPGGLVELIMATRTGLTTAWRVTLFGQTYRIERIETEAPFGAKVRLRCIRQELAIAEAFTPTIGGARPTIGGRSPALRG